MKKKHHEEHVNHERWLVSYADFITLLFAFFVVMYAISDLNSRKAKTVAESVRFATHFVGSGGTNEPGVLRGNSVIQGQKERGGQVGTMEKWIRESASVAEYLAKDLEDALTKQADKKSASVDERGVVITVPVRWFFESASAEPNDKARTFVRRAVEAANKFHRDLRMSGATARVALPKESRYSDSIELQLARLAALERIAVEELQMPADRVEIHGVTSTSRAGAYASPSQVERAAKIELIILR